MRLAGGMSSAPDAGAVCPFDALPVAVLRRIFLALPADSKGRASAVCRAWRDVLADATLWEVLDLSLTGFPFRLSTAALALSAAARAAGGLRVINLGHGLLFSNDDIVELVAAHGGAALRELHPGIQTLDVERLNAILAAAPQLQLLYADLGCTGSEAAGVLRNEPPYGPLRMSSVDISCRDTPPAVLLEAAAAVGAHSQLRTLRLEELTSDDPTILDAFFDVARGASLQSLSLEASFFHPGNDHALARLLQCDTLTSLTLRIEWNGGIDEDNLALLAAALQGAVHLDKLALAARLWNHDNVHVMLGALQTLPALRHLDLVSNPAVDAGPAVMGRALGALLAADWPRLRTLEVEWCDLDDEGMAFVLAGLAANTHLRTLSCMDGNNLSDAFVDDILLPALRVLETRPASP